MFRQSHEVRMSGRGGAPEAPSCEVRQRELRRAFRRKVLQVHPDLVHGDPQRRLEAELQLRRLIQTYESQRRESNVRPAVVHVSEKTRSRGSQPIRRAPRLPARALALGQVLYYLGMLTTDELFSSLRRQRCKSHERLGALLLRDGLISTVQLREALHTQARHNAAVGRLV